MIVVLTCVSCCGVHVRALQQDKANRTFNRRSYIARYVNRDRSFSAVVLILVVIWSISHVFTSFAWTIPLILSFYLIRFAELLLPT